MAQEVDQPVEDQTDAAIATGTVVIADAIASQGEQGQDENSNFWYPILLSSFRLILVQYLLSSTTAMFPDVDPVVIRRAVEHAADDATRRAAEIVAEGVPEMQAPPTPPRGPGRPLSSPEAPLPTRRAEAVRTTAGRASRAAIVGGRESARFEVADKVGAVYKVWRTRKDDRVRPTHGGLEGNRIPLHSEFITFEGNHLRFPRDPLAPLEETAECRCRLSYILKE